MYCVVVVVASAQIATVECLQLVVATSHLVVPWHQVRNNAQCLRRMFVSGVHAWSQAETNRDNGDEMMSDSNLSTMKKLWFNLKSTQFHLETSVSILSGSSGLYKKSLLHAQCSEWQLPRWFESGWSNIFFLATRLLCFISDHYLANSCSCMTLETFRVLFIKANIMQQQNSNLLFKMKNSWHGPMMAF